MDARAGASDYRLEPGDLLTVEEIANLFRLTPAGVIKLKEREKLPCYRVGNRWLFDRFEVALWLAARRTREAEQ
jgi:excisionase family DNA binding protein